ncbi:MAG TPA: LicD family protein [Chitinophagaceae bacterium]|nr:LicD family protein [Chitinophagaceae bacterium]
MKIETPAIDFDLLFSDKREMGENRLQQCHFVMLRMLKILDYLCERHGIHYFLAAGSLLGAIRHKGFIPWDDDMDIGMTRDDYEKFVKYAVPELPYDLFYQNVETDPYYPVYHLVEAKIRDRFSSYSRKEGLEKKYKWHNGIQLDILVFDRSFLPNNYFIYFLNHNIKLLGPTNSANKRAKFLKAIAKYTPVPLVYSSNFIQKRWMAKLGPNYLKESELKAFSRTQFEDMEASIPVGWERYLKRKYGDFMKLPPLEKQKGHHSMDLPDPFTPCDHVESLEWKDRKLATSQIN